MNHCKKNAEGYLDLTAYNALLSADQKRKPLRQARRPLVFICSPFAGDVAANTANAIRYCQFAVRQNMAPFAPHLLYPQFLDDRDPTQRELGISLGLAWLRKCDVVWVFGNRITDGMKREIRSAVKHGMRIKHFNNNLEEITL